VDKKILLQKKKKNREMNCKQLKEKVSIRAVLEAFGLFPKKENGKKGFYFALDREEKTPSFLVDFAKNKGFDFGTGKSYDVISIVQLMKKCSVSEALNALENLNVEVQKKERVTDKNNGFSPKINNEFQSEILPEKSCEILKIIKIQHPALIQYLKSRKTFEQSHLVEEIHYKLNEKNYFGIGFKNNSGGFEIRNPYFKMCLGKKDVKLIENRNNKADEIVVFEGFFDFLTFKNLERKNSKNKNSVSDFLILNSTAMLFKAEESLKKYDKIFLFLDNDSAGNATKKIIQKNYKNVEDCSLLYHDYKDLNEWFCERF
jgi:DNA primase